VHVRRRSGLVRSTVVQPEFYEAFLSSAVADPIYLAKERPPPCATPPAQPELPTRLPRAHLKSGSRRTVRSSIDGRAAMSTALASKPYPSYLVLQSHAGPDGAPVDDAELGPMYASGVKRLRSNHRTAGATMRKPSTNCPVLGRPAADAGAPTAMAGSDGESLSLDRQCAPLWHCP
jgi:hypothetical protein